MASSRKKPDRSTPAGRRAIKAAGGILPGDRRGRVRKTVENNETCLQMHCQQWLEKSGIWTRHLIFHVANERKGGIGAIIHFKRMGVRNGVADYLLFVNDRRVAIELKDDEGEQGPDQIKFQKQWEAAGGLYFVRRSLEEFQGTVHAFVTLKF